MTNAQKSELRSFIRNAHTEKKDIKTVLSELKYKGFTDGTIRNYYRALKPESI